MICDKFLETLGYEKHECTTDEEARAFAYGIPEGSLSYPVVYFESDTSGEKDFEEFYVLGERVNMERFRSLGVIEEVNKRSKQELDVFFKELEEIFISPDFNKREIVEAMQRFLPNFQHIERGKNLDQKM